MATEGISGAELIIEVEGVESGWTTGFRCNEDITMLPVEVLGYLDTMEHIPTARRVGFSASFIRIRNKSLQTQGIIPRGDTVDVLTFPEQTWTMRSRVDGTIVYTLMRARITSRSIGVDSDGILMTDAQGVAIRLLDEEGK